MRVLFFKLCTYINDCFQNLIFQEFNQILTFQLLTDESHENNLWLKKINGGNSATQGEGTWALSAFSFFSGEYLSLTLHFLSPLSPLWGCLCNLPHPKRVPKRPLCSKIGINLCFPREVTPLKGLSAGVEVLDYTQNAATVHAPWRHPAKGSSASGKHGSSRAAGWQWRPRGLPGCSVTGQGWCRGTQPSSNDTPAALTKNRIPCLIWISHLKQDQNSSESSTICFPLRLGHK